MIDESIEKEGFNSYHALKGSFRCPYKVGTSEFNDFERGWVQALKRDPRPVRLRDPDYDPMNGRSCFLDIDPIKTAAEAYARKSGR